MGVISLLSVTNVAVLPARGAFQPLVQCHSLNSTGLSVLGALSEAKSSMWVDFWFILLLKLTENFRGCINQMDPLSFQMALLSVLTILLVH